MKRKTMRLWPVLLVSIILFVQGCSFEENLRHFMQGETREYEPDMPETQELETAEQDSQSEEEPQIREVSELYYAYHCLDADKQQIYLEMLDSLTDLEQDTPLSTVDKSVLDLVFACVMNDHPEFFYVEGYQYTEYTTNNIVTNITFSGTFSMTKQEVVQTQVLIEQNLEECFREVPLNEDEYSTVKFLYEWLIDHTEYDKNAANNQNICSVFLEGRSVCQGYAKAMQYMLQKAQIQCLIVAGFTNGERHGWNLVRVNDEYYYLDPTWGDASYTSNNSEDGLDEFVPSINYDYFLVTTDEITRTHSIEKVVELPQCTAVKDNYFVREGLFLEGYDEQQLAQIFDSDAAREAGYVTIKCSIETYAIMVQNLIESQKIFDFINKQGTSISYTCNENQQTISFWDIY